MLNVPKEILPYVHSFLLSLPFPCLVAFSAVTVVVYSINNNYI